MDEDQHEVLKDALDMSNKSSEGALEDMQEAFRQIPREQLEHAAAVCRDLGNEAVRAGKHEEAAEHYTSVLAAFPADHEVLCNRSLCYLTVGEQKGGPRMDEYFQLALQDAAMCVNVKPTWVKGLYRLGCALQKCKEWKSSVAVFTKVCEMDPDNVEASGRLIQAREMLQMVLNVERVNDPLWMHKPEPPKTDLQKNAEAAQETVDTARNEIREQLGKVTFDFGLLDRCLSKVRRRHAAALPPCRSAALPLRRAAAPPLYRHAAMPPCCRDAVPNASGALWCLAERQMVRRLTDCGGARAAPGRPLRSPCSED